MHKAKVFVENIEMLVKETEEVLNKTFEVDGEKFITRIDTKIEFVSSIYSYGNLLIYLKREDILSDTIFGVYLFNKDENKEYYLVKLSESQDVFINKFETDNFYIVSLNLEENYGEITFCNKNKTDYAKNSINFTKLNSIDRFEDGLLINCYEETENEKLYNITQYFENGKIKKVFFDESISLKYDYESKFENGKLKIKKVKR